MKIKAILLVSLILILALPAFATSTPDSEDVEEKQEEISKYEKKLEELRGKVSTLANEVEYIDTQISLTELNIQNSAYKIKRTQDDILKISDDITDLSLRIDKLSASIEYQTKVLGMRMRERYKSREESVVMLFGSEDIAKLVQKAKFLMVMGKHDQVFLADMKKTKDDFDTQKRLFEQKKNEQVSLKSQLESEKANLDSYKGSLLGREEEKKRLLEITQNDEAKYQKLLAEAQRELNQIVGAAVVLKNTKATKVEKGDVIGVQGNSGYSFGEHLHFGVYRYSSFDDITGWNWYYSNYVDPSKELSRKTVYWDTGCESPRNKTVGNGDWQWPIKNPTVSQGFGHTCWSNRYYGGKAHPAYDLYGPSGSPIYAVDDGDAYSCRNCLGDGGNGVFIFHDDDFMTVYWHLR